MAQALFWWLIRWSIGSQEGTTNTVALVPMMHMDRSKPVATVPRSSFLRRMPTRLVTLRMPCAAPPARAGAAAPKVGGGSSAPSIGNLAFLGDALWAVRNAMQGKRL